MLGARLNRHTTETAGSVMNAMAASQPKRKGLGAAFHSTRTTADAVSAPIAKPVGACRTRCLTSSVSTSGSNG